MNEIQTLEREILGAIDAASDEAALEALRVSALGKKGSVSELLKTLGGYSQISVMFLLRITSASRVKLPARHQCTRLFMAIGPWLILVAGNFAALTQKCRFSLIPVAMPISRCRPLPIARRYPVLTRSISAAIR